MWFVTEPLDGQQGLLQGLLQGLCSRRPPQEPQTDLLPDQHFGHVHRMIVRDLQDHGAYRGWTGQLRANRNVMTTLFGDCNARPMPGHPSGLSVSFLSCTWSDYLELELGHDSREGHGSLLHMSDDVLFR